MDNPTVHTDQITVKLQPKTPMLFRVIHKNNLIYNTCWEDPAVDRIALDLTEKDRLLVITSAGCNALDYLLAGCGEVSAVDCNPIQNALLELKRIAILKLQYEDFFTFFGRGRRANARKIYNRALRSGLSEFAQRYWDSHISFFEGANKNSSFYYRGTSGFIAKMVTYLLKARGLKHAVAELYECNTLHEQREVYERSIGPRLWTPTVEWLIARESTMALLGVPAAQKALMDEQYPGGVVGYVKFCLQRVLTELPWRDNYFYRVYLRGAYTEDCCPEYLKADTFETLRGRVKDLHIHTNTVAGYLEKLEVKFSRFVLLDHMDWMSKYDVAGLTHEWNTILASATDGARAIFRSAAVRVDFLNNVMVQRAGARVPLLDFITFDKERATALHSKDRVGTYASFHIANLHPTV